MHIRTCLVVLDRVESFLVLCVLEPHRFAIALLLGCTVSILVFASETFSWKSFDCYERQKRAYFHLVTQTVPLLVSLGAQSLSISSSVAFISVRAIPFVSGAAVCGSSRLAHGTPIAAPRTYPTTHRIARM